MQEDAMHDFDFDHEHELEEHHFLGCCKNCRRSLEIIKPYILSFYERIKNHTPATLAILSPEDLYRLYQLLDDIAHLEVGDHLGELILTDPDIIRVLPAIRSYYSAFFSLHEVHVVETLLEADDPWEAVESYPLYPRYEVLIRNHVEILKLSPQKTLAFIGCGPLPLSLILLCRQYGMKSIGLDNDQVSVTLAKRCIATLEMEDDIKIVHGDESLLEELDWDCVVVSGLAEPKGRIFQNLRLILKKKGALPVIYRTYSGIRAVLYLPAQPEDIEGFKIINHILPTGRVNNTLVLLKLE
jgi:hypothetical protein